MPDDDYLRLLEDIAHACSQVDPGRAFTDSFDVEPRLLFVNARQTLTAIVSLARGGLGAPLTALIRPLVEDTCWLTEYVDADRQRQRGMAAWRMRKGYAELVDLVGLAERQGIDSASGEKRQIIANRKKQVDAQIRAERLRKGTPLSIQAATERYLGKSYRVSYKIAQSAVHSGMLMTAMYQVLDEDSSTIDVGVPDDGEWVRQSIGMALEPGLLLVRVGLKLSGTAPDVYEDLRERMVEVLGALDEDTP